ncbi:cold-shock protein [Sphingobacterium faecale]|uniref:Cold shock domain-containing protein n=1 Tax=Sphingobacterium faecale TaxID=2803775 RepID=A0ABS1QXJ4_9SPHI|nr:cold shock domain-containing protein [Sphingobacterium faecale]MBL1407138.1 cold shock domain-containing protein [Sphingobacterium faecale]
MAKSQLTFNKKERAKKKQQKKQEKQERREINKSNNNKGKSLEEMFAYVDEFGNISDTPPTQVYKFKEEDLHRPVEDEDEFLYGKVSYYNDTGNYGFIRDNQSRDTVYFNDKLAGKTLSLNQQVKYKYIRTKQGNQISEVELI